MSRYAAVPEGLRHEGTVRRRIRRLRRSLKPEGPLASAPPALITALIILAAVCSFGLLLLMASGHLSRFDAATYALAPWLALAAVFRPDWFLLALIAMPASFTAIVQARRILVLVVLALVTILFTRPRFSLALRTGLVALPILIAAGLLLQAHVAPAATASNRGMMLDIAYYSVLALLAFNLAYLGELQAEAVAVAFTIGAGTTFLVALLGYGNAWFPSGAAVLGYLGYLAAGSLGVCLGWLLMPGRPRGNRVAVVVGTLAFFALTIMAYRRGPWFVAAITLVVLALRSGRRRYLLILVAATVLALATPSAREELASSPTGNIGASINAGTISTGRLELWAKLWDRAVPAFPLGRGFGYMWSLSPGELFGNSSFDSSGLVFPHNDFIYLAVEFGIPGMLLLLMFWILLLRARLELADSSDPRFRAGGYLLLGILVMGLMMALVDNLFAYRPVAERFFPVAGFVFGLAALRRRRKRRRRSPSISQARDLVGAA